MRCLVVSSISSFLAMWGVTVYRRRRRRWPVDNRMVRMFGDLSKEPVTAYVLPHGSHQMWVWLDRWCCRSYYRTEILILIFFGDGATVAFCRGSMFVLCRIG